MDWTAVNDPQPKGWGLVEDPLPARVDQPQPLGEEPEGYVRDEYIGTLGCFSSPRLCGEWLNRLRVKSVLLPYKTVP